MTKKRYTNFFDSMIDGSYKSAIYGDESSYNRYVKKMVVKVLRYYKGGTVLSVGCGTGDIEASLPFPVVCYDIHNAAQILHPELNFQASWPKEQFDLVICLGAVMSYIPTEEQEQFVSNLLASTNEKGTVLLHALDYGGTQQDVIVEHLYPVKWPNHQKIKVV